MKSKTKNLTILLAVAALICMTGFTANAAAKATSASASSNAKRVFAGIPVTVNDTKTPATYSGGTDWPITTYYFFSADNKKLGSISGKALMKISDTAEYRASHDASVWLADMFNEYRVLGTDSRKESQKDQIEEFRNEVIRLTNLEREKAGLPALAIDQDAMEYAQIRAKECSISYSHTRPNGVDKEEINGSRPIENIVSGSTTPEQAVQAWMNSKTHRGGIFDKNAYAIGVGCYKDSNGILYWTQEFVW